MSCPHGRQLCHECFGPAWAKTPTAHQLLEDIDEALGRSSMGNRNTDRGERFAASPPDFDEAIKMADAARAKLRGFFDDAYSQFVKCDKCGAGLYSLRYLGNACSPYSRQCTGFYRRHEYSKRAA